MAHTKLSITVPPELVSQIDLRSDGERSGVIARDLDRYYYLLAEGKRTLRNQLSRSELGLILDTCNGTIFSEPFSVAHIDHEIADAIRLDSLDTKWEIDGPALIEKLTGLTYASKLALVDCIERWWIRIGNGEQELSPLVAVE